MNLIGILGYVEENILEIQFKIMSLPKQRLMLITPVPQLCDKFSSDKINIIEFMANRIEYYNMEYNSNSYELTVIVEIFIKRLYSR